MEIKKNMKFVCIKDVLMEDDGEVNYVKGDVYTSERDGTITNMLGEKGHLWSNGWEEFRQHFIPYYQLDKVYTKHTPLLENIIDKYEGERVVKTCGDIKFFDNVSLEETGWFVSTSWVGEDYYQERGYTYLSEKAFIEFMDLGKYLGSLNTEDEEEVKESERILSQANDFKDITDSIADLLQYKNTKYGNSALEPLKIFSDKCKVGTRIDDKLARIKNSDSLKKNDVADLIGYCVLICKENGWNNFDEFKD